MLTGISFVLPAYNEEGNIGDAIDACRNIAPKVAQKYEVIVVNDGSTDGTKEVVQSLAKADPNVILVNHDINQGFGSAIRDGFDAARYDYIFYTDGDAQFNIGDITLLLPHIEESDFVIGYRIRRADPARRRFNAYVYNMLVRTFMRIPVKDVDCAFKLMKTSTMRSLQVSAETGFFFAELMHKAKKSGFRIYEVPVTHYPRRHGEQTGGNIAVILKVIRDMLSYALSSRRRQYMA